VIADDAGRVLLVRHSYGELNWEIPGGAGELGESAEQCAVREVHEETGLDVVAERMTGVYFEPSTRCHHFVFVCRPTSTGEPRPSSPEITEVRWCDRAALPRPISDFTIRRIDDALAAGPAALHRVAERRWLR
jgi:8-oxo-dGTP diphosphatase